MRVAIRIAVTFIIVAVLAYARPSSNFQTQLDDLAAKTNATCPKMADPNTRLDSVQTAKNSIRYNYTLVNLEQAPADHEASRIAIRAELLKRLDANGELKIFFKNGCTMTYAYRDKHGMPAVKIDITPADFGY